jgi:hypothetical protein
MAYDLPSLIRSVPDFATKTAAECRAYFAEAPVTLKTARYNANDLMVLLTPQVACALANGLQSAGMGLVAQSLATTNGIDFGHETTQAMLTTLGQNPAFAPYVAELKALGKDTRTRWAREGLTEDLPGLAEFETAHEEALLVQQKLDAQSAKLDLIAAIDQRINDGTMTAEKIFAIPLPQV